MSAKKPADWPERNVTLLRDTLEFIELHPDRHDQAHWVNQCRTAFCYAGHAALLAGATLPDASVTEFGHFWMIHPETYQSVGYTTYSGVASGCIAVDEFAAQRLGITEAEAEVMFAADRTVGELRLLVDALCDDAWITADEDIHFGDGTCEYVTSWLEGSDDD